MTGQEMLDALDDHGGGIRVETKSGAVYNVERDVVTANANEPDPYIYGWPVKPHPRGPRGPKWFYARNVRLAEPCDRAAFEAMSKLTRERDELLNALAELEAAQDAVTGLRSQSEYNRLVLEGHADTLLRLDDARRNARMLVQKLSGGQPAPQASPKPGP